MLRCHSSLSVPTLFGVLCACLEDGGGGGGGAMCAFVVGAVMCV